MIYVSVNDQRYPATITGRVRDTSWNDRESKTITVDMTYEEAKTIFVEDVKWSIVETYEMEHIEYDADGNPNTVTTVEENVYDNNDFSMAGDITDHRNGSVSVKMGKPTAAELLALIEEAF